MGRVGSHHFWVTGPRTRGVADGCGPLRTLPRSQGVSRLVRRGMATCGAVLALGLAFGSGEAQAAPTSTTSQCASGSCSLNVGGTFVWHATDGSASGQFTGSLVLFPRIAQASCTAVADADTSRPQTVPTSGGPPHPGLIVPFPFTAPGPGKPLAAYIDITTYHGPGTYTQTSLAHQTYVYPAGSQSVTAPADSPGASWSVTMDPDGSGHLTYSGPAQHNNPLAPPPTIQLSMSWTCDDTATPNGAAAAPVTPASSPASAAAPVPTSKGSGVNLWLVFVPVLGVLLMILFLVAMLRRRRRRPPLPCTCQVSFSVTGPTQIGVRDCARKDPWVITSGTLSAILTGHEIEGRNFKAIPVIECTGGGTAEITGVEWSVQQTHPWQLIVTFVAHVAVSCPDGTVTQTQQTVETAVELVSRACCGPDITEVYLKSINRSLDRLRLDRPLSSTYFMARWGIRMICRPFAPGTFNAFGCPSSWECADTVTIVGRCVDCYVPDNFLFGVMAGWVDIPVAELELMGWGAKLTKTHGAVVAGHVISEQLWLVGHAFGQSAHQNAISGRPYHLDRATLERSLRVAQSRDDCGVCQDSVGELFIDFSLEDW